MTRVDWDKGPFDAIHLASGERPRLKYWRPWRTPCYKCVYSDSVYVIGKQDYCALRGETFMTRTGCFYGHKWKRLKKKVVFHPSKKTVTRSKLPDGRRVSAKHTDKA